MENRNIQEYSIWKKKIKIFHSLIFLKFFLIKASQHESPKHNNRRKSSCRQKRSFFVKSSPYFFFLLNLTMPNLWIPSRVFWIPCSVNLRMFLLVCVFCCLKKKKPWSKKEKKQKKWAQPFFFLCFFFFFFLFGLNFYFFFCCCYVPMCYLYNQSEDHSKETPNAFTNHFSSFFKRVWQSTTTYANRLQFTRVFLIFLLWLNITCVLLHNQNVCLIEMHFGFCLVLRRLWAAAVD